VNTTMAREIMTADVRCADSAETVLVAALRMAGLGVPDKTDYPWCPQCADETADQQQDRGLARGEPVTAGNLALRHGTGRLARRTQRHGRFPFLAG
jgi:hypothetical protein